MEIAGPEGDDPRLSATSHLSAKGFLLPGQLWNVQSLRGRSVS